MPAEKSITPEMKVGEFLDLFPEMEDDLLELSPAFRKLQNPVLRRTVARVTTLRQAAKVGGVDLATLINRLRDAVGQTTRFKSEGDIQDTPSKPPSWLSMDSIVRKIDVGPMIEMGEKPVGKVMRELAGLGEGEILEITSPFLPAPLIDLAREKGFEAWHRDEPGGLYRVYFHQSQLVDLE